MVASSKLGIESIKKVGKAYLDFAKTGQEAMLSSSRKMITSNSLFIDNQTRDMMQMTGQTATQAQGTQRALDRLGLSFDDLQTGKLTEAQAKAFEDLRDREMNKLAQLESVGTQAFGAIQKGQMMGMQVQQDIQDMLMIAMASAGPAIEQVMGSIGDALNQIMPVVESIMPSITELINLLPLIIEPLIPVVNILIGLIATLMPLIVTIVENVLTPLGPIIETLLSALVPVIEIIVKLISGALEPLMSVINFLATLLTTVIELMMPILNILMAVLLPVLSALTPIFNVLSGIIKALSPVIEILIGVLLVQLMPVILIVMTIVNALSLVLQALGPIIEILLIFLQPLLEIFNALSPVLEVFTWALGKMGEAVEWISDKIGKFFGKAKKDAQELSDVGFSSITSTIPNVGTTNSSQYNNTNTNSVTNNYNYGGGPTSDITNNNQQSPIVAGLSLSGLL